MVTPAEKILNRKTGGLASRRRLGGIRSMIRTGTHKKDSMVEVCAGVYAVRAVALISFIDVLPRGIMDIGFSDWGSISWSQRLKNS